MSDKKPETLLVMPVTGKYCEVVSNQNVFKIWKVHPNTPDTFGTPLPYDVAVKFLGKTPSVITLVPKTAKGQFVNQLLPEDQETIQNSLKRGFVSAFKNFNKSSTAISVEGGSNEALTKTLEVLDAQIKKNASLEETLVSLTNRLALLEANAGQPTVEVKGDATTNQPPAL